MADLGAVKCDFCGHTSNMVKNKAGNFRAPEMWVTIGYNLKVSAGVLPNSPNVKAEDRARVGHFRKEAEKIKDIMREQLPTMHACPGCSTKRVADDLIKKLPGKAETVFSDERVVN